MKNVFLVFILFIACATAFAQPGERMRERFESLTPEERAKQQTERMTAQLNLTAEQIPQVEAINLKYEKLAQEKYEANKDSDDPTVFFQSMREMRDQKNEALKAVLTEDQMKKLQEMNPRGPGQGPPDEPKGGKRKKSGDQ